MPDKSIYFSNPDNNFFSSVKVLQHSLNTPLSSLLTNLELLAQDSQLNFKQLNSHLYLKRCVLSAQYLKEIITQADQLETTLVNSFYIKEAIQEVIEISKNPKRQGLLLPFLQLEAKTKLAGNKVYFQEMLICLLNNAFQAYAEHAPNKLVLLFANKNQDNLQLKVVDAGQGFLCLKDSGTAQIPGEPILPKGTGLNFIEQVIAHHFHGQILVKSAPQQGTSVHCSLPLFKQ